MPIEGSKTERKFAPVILAGGSGTRFWPRSRRTRAKQVLALDGERTMIQQTVERLLPLAAAERCWVITNDLLTRSDCGTASRGAAGAYSERAGGAEYGPGLRSGCVSAGEDRAGDGDRDFSSDHVVKNRARFVEVIRAGVELAAQRREASWCWVCRRRGLRLVTAISSWARRSMLRRCSGSCRFRCGG